MNTLSDAKKLIEDEIKARVQRCQGRIQQVLTEENCLLEASMIVNRHGAFPHINIVPNEGTVQ